MNETTTNTGKHLNNIIAAVPCPTHAADIGEACWVLHSPAGSYNSICNSRALAAGANGEVTPYVKPEFYKKKESR